MKQHFQPFVIALALAMSTPVFAAPPIVAHHQEEYALNSGTHSNLGAEASQAFETTVRSPGAPWMRLFFADAHLGENSYVLITSKQDGGQQRLDSASIKRWHNSSAFFNGPAVTVELYVAPGDRDVFFKLHRITVGEWMIPDGDEGGIATICGSDNRVTSTDNRVGRLYFGGCSAWRITTGAMLSAGHCVDFDPDQGGPGLPDGVLDLSGVVEFNTPASLANGNTVAADPDDQYPIDIVPTTDVVWNFDGLDSIGEDWAVFEIGPNSNTGLLPHEAYGLPLRITRESPPVGETIRITGFGSDDGNDNFTNQTSTGPYLEEASEGANDISHEYLTDTEGGNSGSPVIWEDNQLAIGIHTNAGCSNPVDPDEGNHGTSFENTALETAIRNVISSLAKFVDVNHPLRVAEEGTVYRPYSTVTLAITNVADNGIVSIVEGNYTAAAGNTFLAGSDGTAMTLTAPVGTVTIGN